MSVLHIQIRFCSQCETRLPDKCAKCIKHPDRKPRVIELYDFPEVIKTAECGCCVFIQCQRDPCKNKFWRCVKRNYAVGKTTAKMVVCKSCRTLPGSDSKKNSVWVECSCPCKQKMLREPGRIKGHKYIYFSKKHMYEHRKQLDLKNEMAAMLACYSDKCRGEVQEHEWNGYGRYKCKVCGNIRKSTTSKKEVARQNGELLTLNPKPS